MKYDDLTMRECRYLIKQKCGEFNDVLNPFNPDEEWHRRAATLKDLALLSDRLRIATANEMGVRQKSK